MTGKQWTSRSLAICSHHWARECSAKSQCALHLHKPGEQSKDCLDPRHRARTINLRVVLTMTHKGNLSITEYVAKMKNLGDDMAAARRKIDDEELVEYILSGLEDDFESVVSAV
jgi:hypothetical protein